MTRVSVGLLCRPGQLLFARRTQHQTHSGQWEFPGGKVEPGESCYQGLVRELEEEIGVQVQSMQPLLRHVAWKTAGADIELHFYLVTHWQGKPIAREGQQLGWYTKSELIGLELLPSNVKLLKQLLAAVDAHTNLLRTA